MKMKVTREHKLVGLTSIGIKAIAPSKIKTRRFCKRHTKEEIKMACVDCNEALCIVCKLTNHEHHNTKDVEDMAKETRKELTDLTSKVHENTRIVVDNIDAVKRKIDDIKRLKDDNIDKVNEQARLYIQKVNQNKEQMITDIDTTFKGNLSNLEEHLRSLEISQANMKQLAQLANCLKQTADDAGVVSLGSQLKERLKDSEGNVKPRSEMADVSQPKFTATQIPEVVLGLFVDAQSLGNAKESKKGNDLQQTEIEMIFDKLMSLSITSDATTPSGTNTKQEPKEPSKKDGIPEFRMVRRPQYPMERPVYKVERPVYPVDFPEYQLITDHNI